MKPFERKKKPPKREQAAPRALRLTAKENEQVNAACALQKISFSELVRRALQKYLGSGLSTQPGTARISTLGESPAP